MVLALGCGRRCGAAQAAAELLQSGILQHMNKVFGQVELTRYSWAEMRIMPAGQWPSFCRVLLRLWEHNPQEQDNAIQHLSIVIP